MVWLWLGGVLFTIGFQPKSWNSKSIWGQLEILVNWPYHLGQSLRSYTLENKI